MRILFLGEYSGFYNNLAEGFKNKGHNVTMISDGDNFKNYYRDVNIGSNHKNPLIRQGVKIFYQLFYLNKMKGYDIVFVINPLVFSRFNFVKLILSYIIRNNKKVIYTVAGDDSIFWKAFRENKYEYSPHQGSLKDEGKSKSLWESRRCIKITEWFIKKNITIITCCVEYKIAYDSYLIPNVFIPLPIKTTIVRPSSLSNKINILHGVQSKRKGFKGNAIIDEAMQLILQKYSSIINYKRIEDLPFHEYSKLMDDADIIFDQVFSYGPGMNALDGLAKGKVVIGGFELIHKKQMKVEYDYIINVKPTVSDIVEKMELIINNLELINEKKSMGINYVVSFHSIEVVIKNYIALIDDLQPNANVNK
jgi:hypothetical protein